MSPDLGSQVVLQKIMRPMQQESLERRAALAALKAAAKEDVAAMLGGFHWRSRCGDHWSLLVQLMQQPVIMCLHMHLGLVLSAQQLLRLLSEWLSLLG